MPGRPLYQIQPQQDNEHGDHKGWNAVHDIAQPDQPIGAVQIPQQRTQKCVVQNVRPQKDKQAAEQVVTPGHNIFPVGTGNALHIEQIGVRVCRHLLGRLRAQIESIEERVSPNDGRKDAQDAHIQQRRHKDEAPEGNHHGQAAFHITKIHLSRAGQAGEAECQKSTFSLHDMSLPCLISHLPGRRPRAAGYS